MECFNCSKISISEINCPFCSKNLCTFLCLETHLKSNHQANNTNSKNNVYEKPKISRFSKINKPNKQNEYNISSPYITYGFIAKNITYDKKYELKNFVPEIDDYETLVIGNGSYGRVYLYRNMIDQKLYAIKHMEKERLKKTLKTLQGIYGEIYYQSRIFHQNIVRLLYVTENEDSFDLIMEYANGGSLFYYIRDNNYLSEKESFKIFSQIINAVYFLHKNDLIHRDIKPENILLYDNNNICKLCDFGWCVKYDGRQRRTFCGTTEYMSPEIVNNMEYSKEIDVWSLGILLYEMVHGYSPFRPDKDDFNAKDVINNIKIHDLKFNNNISKECKELIIHLLDENVENRYKIEDIFNSNFVKKYENKNLYFPKENINGFKKVNNEVKPIIKLNNNKNENKNKINENNNKINENNKNENNNKINENNYKKENSKKENNNKISENNNKNENNNKINENNIKKENNNKINENNNKNENSNKINENNNKKENNNKINENNNKKEYNKIENNNKINENNKNENNKKMNENNNKKNENNNKTNENNNKTNENNKNENNNKTNENSKIENNKTENNNKTNEKNKNNIGSNYKLDFSQKRKIKNYSSQKMYRTFLNNVSMIKKEK